MNIIKIVLGMALTLASSSSASGIGQARVPAVVRTDGQKDIAAVRADEVREELGSPLNVKVDIVTVSVGSTTTVFGSELHETSLTVTAGSGWVARGFLHSERGEHNALETVLISILIKQVDIIGARSKDAVGSKFGRDKFVHSHHGRSPASSVETTVEPVFGAVGDFRVRVGVATNSVSDSKKAGAGRPRA